MDLARVYVGPFVSVLVPSSWSAWTWNGVSFKREHGAVWQECDPGVWMLPETSVVRMAFLKGESESEKGAAAL